MVTHGGATTFPIRRVANTTFYLHNNTWNQAEYVTGTPTRRIKVFGEEYFALARRDRRAAQFMAQGANVIFVLDGVAYETVTAD